MRAKSPHGPRHSLMHPATCTLARLHVELGKEVATGGPPDTSGGLVRFPSPSGGRRSPRKNLAIRYRFRPRISHWGQAGIREQVAGHRRPAPDAKTNRFGDYAMLTAHVRSEFRHLFARAFGAGRRPKPAGRQLAFEPLDARLVPAYISGGNLLIDGTPGADTVVVRTGAYGTVEVTENGRAQTFLRSAVTSGKLGFAGGGGNDRFDASGLTTLQVNVNAGPGVDTIYGGALGDVLAGEGDGDDIRGLGGNDVIYGNDGNDWVLAGDGADSVYGGYGNDTLAGEAQDDKLYGEPGEDVLYGNDGNDEMWGDNWGNPWGGEGNDTLFGGQGNDNLHGEGGTDWLLGGEGSDGLFGGRDARFDDLYGGPGADRFLMPAGMTGINEDSASDAESVDARIIFRDSPALAGVTFYGQEGEHSFEAGAWDNGQIERVDVALANLHRHTGNTRLLTTADRKPMSFLAVGKQTSQGFQSGGWNTGTQIVFVNLPTISTSYLERTVYHEFGHNWDAPEENRHVGAFRAVTGWIENPVPQVGFTASTGANDTWQYLTSKEGTFARTDYGRENPYEDMATTWEAYFVNAYHGGAAGLAREGLTANADKWATLDALFADLRQLP